MAQTQLLPGRHQILLHPMPFTTMPACYSQPCTQEAMLHLMPCTQKPCCGRRPGTKPSKSNDGPACAPGSLSAETSTCGGDYGQVTQEQGLQSGTNLTDFARSRLQRLPERLQPTDSALASVRCPVLGTDTWRARTGACEDTVLPPCSVERHGRY